MKEFSDYIVYVDESGDHSLKSIDKDYPVFVLAFCVFKKSDYVEIVVPALQAFKFKWFGEDTVVLHENEISKKKGVFSFLQNTERRERFIGELDQIFATMPMTVIPTVIRKEALRSQYASPDNPYHLSLLFCMEMLQGFLEPKGQAGKTTHIVFEQRGGKAGGGIEDRDLELEFLRIKDGKHYLARSKQFPDFDYRIVNKQINSTGLQIADLVARPLGRRTINPDQPNRAFDTIKAMLGCGTKIFP